MFALLGWACEQRGLVLLLLEINFPLISFQHHMVKLVASLQDQLCPQNPAASTSPYPFESNSGLNSTKLRNMFVVRGGIPRQRLVPPEARKTRDCVGRLRPCRLAQGSATWLCAIRSTSCNGSGTTIPRQGPQRPLGRPGFEKMI